MTLRRPDGTRFGARVPLEVWRRWRVGQPVALRQADGQNPQRLDVLPADSLSACRRWHQGRDRDDPPGGSLGCSPRPPD